jgi:hypothetical protein
LQVFSNMIDTICINGFLSMPSFSSMLLIFMKQQIVNLLETLKVV